MPGRVATPKLLEVRAPRFVGALASILVFGCAGHAARTEGARTALDAGRPGEALKLLDEQLEVEKPTEVPAKVGGDNALLILDRAMVLQEIASRSEVAASKEYALSSRDLELADKQIEVLDLSRSAVADIGKYLFSDDTGPYKAPTYEKFMINTMNMVNYLARGDLNGSKIEARRLAVMQKFIADHEGHGASLTGPGSYLAGFTFEKSGDEQEALRFYDEALAYGSYPSLVEPVRRLSAIASYRSPRLRELLKDTDSGRTASLTGGAAAVPIDDSGEILVVLGFGRVPSKIARRIPKPTTLRPKASSRG
jgi:hypothetical protein